jgi:hypothetical protein
MPAVKKLTRETIKSQLKYAPVWIQKNINNLYQSAKDVD